ncbi:MAG: hypothetical protein IJF09_09185 [Ruminiclostridium sp.]|nr:hypothetical protein [Ruminiclostridium sp.]
MILEDLYSLAPQFTFTEDRATNSIYGTYKGFGMMLKGNEQNNCFIFTTWARKGALSNNSVEQWFNEYTAKPENNFIRATDVNNYTIAAVIAADDSSAGTITRLTMFIYDITSFLTSNYYSNACAQCGSAIGLSIGNDSDGVRTQLCKMCTENEADEAAQNMVNQQPLINDQPQQAMFGANGFAEPVQVTQNTYNAQPQQPTFGANGFANPVQPQQAVQNTFNAQPQQATFGANGFANPVQPQQNSMGVGMGAVGMMGAAPQNSGGAMGAIDPATAPESTGFTTAADLAALEPPSAASFTNNYSSTPLPNDFRADPAYSGGPVGVTPIARNPVKESINSNPFMGFIGAVLFALIACVIWVLFGMMGRISYIGGLAMGFCTVTGYKLLGKKFDVFGIISCIVVIALAVLGSNLFIVTTTLFQQSGIEESLAYLGYNGFADVFFNFFSLATTLDELLVAAGEKATIMSSFLLDLGIGYLLSGVGFCVVGIPAFKERNY